MATKITVLKVANNPAPDGKKYRICELGYKTDDGKVKGMRIFNFGPQKAIFDVAAAASPGDVLDASFGTNAKGYWEFTSLTATGEKADASAPATSTGGTSRSGNWETSEERKLRQLYIIRQSSISNAIELLGNDASSDEVIEAAEVFVNYVLNGVPSAE